MTPDPHSADLDRIKSLLAKSFDADEGHDAPPLPESLRDRLTDQYGRTETAPSLRAKAEKVFAKLSLAFAKPAFAGATAAILLTLIAVILIKQPATETTFRGGTSESDSVTIVLYQLHESTTKAIRDSGYFDEKALRSIQSPEELSTISPPMIVLDGSTGTIRALGTGEATPTTSALPDDPAKLPDLIAELLRSL